MKRIDEIVVTVLVRTYNDAGYTVEEEQAAPIRLFRGATPDVWARLDEELNKLEEESK
jgi:hypothetical protein